MVAYGSWHMLKAPPLRLEGALNRRRDCGRLQRMSKKILNRGNEPKDLLETQHLAVFGAKNEPKTNSILSAKSAENRELGTGNGGPVPLTWTTRQGMPRKHPISSPLLSLPCSLFPVPCSWQALRHKTRCRLGRGCYFPTLGFRPAAQSRLLATGRLLDFEKLNEQCGNIYENKGPLWKTCPEAGMS